MVEHSHFTYGVTFCSTMEKFYIFLKQYLSVLPPQKVHSFVIVIAILNLEITIMILTNCRRKSHQVAL